MRENGIEFIDFSAALREDREIYADDPRFEESYAYRILGLSRLPELLGWLCLEELDPEPALRNPGLLKHVERVHAARSFVDDLGHPTRRGHHIIAEEIFDYLSRSDPPLRTAPPPRLPD